MASVGSGQAGVTGEAGAQILGMRSALVPGSPSREGTGNYLGLGQLAVILEDAERKLSMIRVALVR